MPLDWLKGDREYFTLLVRGDSMYPEYLAGDVVIIRKQSTCDDGDDCAVVINGTDGRLIHNPVQLFGDKGTGLLTHLSV
jgi:repressor LexA